MTEFLPRIESGVVEIAGKRYPMTREFYAALSRAFKTLGDSDAALAANDAAITAILQSLGAEDVASLQALGDLLAGKQDKDEALTSLSQLTATGLLSFTGGNFNSRTLTPVAGETTVTNGNGVAGNPTVGVADVANSGAGTLQAITRDGKGRITGTKAATITGTAGRVTVANGTAAAGLPTIDLATVADAGGGTLQRTAFDTYGRKTGTSAATTDHLTEGAANLYHTAARVRAVALTGLSTATNAVITATDTVLSAFGKLQAQVTANLSRSVHTGTQLASTISDFAATVRATVLTGLSTATATAITAADTVLGALGKLQGQITALPTLSHGTYTPTITNGANVDASTAYVCQWMRVGNVVTVSGRVDVDATAAASTLTFIDMSLPIASAFAAANQCGGGSVIQQATYAPITIIAQVGSGSARFLFKSTDTVNSNAWFTFTYLIV